MIGSDRVVKQEYFISSEDGYIHMYPVEDHHVSYKDEKLFNDLDDLISSEGGRRASPCPKCLEPFIAGAR